MFQVTLLSPLGVHLSNALALHNATSHDDAVFAYRAMQDLAQEVGLPNPPAYPNTNFPFADVRRVYISPFLKVFRGIFSTSLTTILDEESDNLLLTVEEEGLVSLPPIFPSHATPRAFENGLPLVDLVDAGLLTVESASRYARALLKDLKVYRPLLEKRVEIETQVKLDMLEMFGKSYVPGKGFDPIPQDQLPRALYPGDEPLLYYKVYPLYFRHLTPLLGTLLLGGVHCFNYVTDPKEVAWTQAMEQIGIALLIPFIFMYLCGWFFMDRDAKNRALRGERRGDLPKRLIERLESTKSLYQATKLEHKKLTKKLRKAASR